MATFSLSVASSKIFDSAVADRRPGTAETGAMLTADAILKVQISFEFENKDCEIFPRS